MNAQEILDRLDNELRIMRYHGIAITIMANEVERIGRQNQAAQPIMEALNYFIQNYNRLNNQMRNELDELDEFIG